MWSTGELERIGEADDLELTRVRAGGIDRDVESSEVGGDVNDAVDNAESAA